MTVDVKDSKIKPVVFLIVLFAIPNIIFLITFGMGKITGTKWMTEKHAIIKTEAILINFDLKKLADHKDISLDIFEQDIKKRLETSKAGEFGKKICKDEKCTFSVLGMQTDRLYQIIRPLLKTMPLDAGYLEFVHDLKKPHERIKKDFY
jgi:hypothetical protein